MMDDGTGWVQVVDDDDLAGFVPQWSIQYM